MLQVLSFLVTVAVVLALAPNALSANDKAWQALANLQVVEAKRLFAEARVQHPEDLSLMRGLYLSAALDLDRDMQVDMVDSMIHYHPGDPYLLAIFEHVVVDMEGWREQSRLQWELGGSLASHSKGALAYSGLRMQEGSYQRKLESPPPKWKEAVNKAPGFWICGPFDNTSHIAVYRPLAIEAVPHDTLTAIQAMHGYAGRWTWLETNAKGAAFVGQTTENVAGGAYVMRVFFEVPLDTEVLILPGGAYSGRVLIDGYKVLESIRYRNAVVREGCRAKLTAGIHGLTVVVCDVQDAASLSLSILDPEYEPIDGFRWLRHGQSSESAPTQVAALHPLFDTWEAHLDTVGEAPDSRYWRAILMIYNGHQREAVTYLEALHQSGEATLLELSALYSALVKNNEASRALDVLSQIREKGACVAVDVSYHLGNLASYAEAPQIFERLRDQYGSRVEIDMMIALRPLLNSDISGFKVTMDSLIERNPNVASLHEILYRLYSGMGEQEEVRTQYRLYCEKTENELAYNNSLAQLLMNVGRYDEACVASLSNIGFRPIDATINQALAAHRLARRMEELLPLLDSLIERYPVKLELYAHKHMILSETGRNVQADSVLRNIHSIKPTAILPYLRLSELHNNIALDSILGTVDVMSFWDAQPDSSDLARNNIWTLFDRRQFLITENGPVLNDYHLAHVVMDEAAVQDAQEYVLPIDLSKQSNSLITARRLRRGSSPLQAQQNGDTLIFQDLQAGDAVELRYRYWSGVSGDLWRHWWSTYQAQAAYFQRHWEYVILTDRSDLSYSANALFPQPIEDTHCGYRRYIWRGENTPAANTDLWYQPPDNEMMGRLYLTTLDSWDSVAIWYGAVTEAILRDNPRVETLADSLTEDLTDELEKLKALYGYTVLQIPYQALGFDYDASIPHDPDQVLINGWGDCKDKSFLLIAMLRRIGLEAWPVLVQTWSRGEDLPVPQFGFDHLIVACRVGVDTTYLDPAGDPNPVGPWLAVGNSGQPCLHIANSSPNQTTRLPELSADYLIREDTMTVRVSVGKPSSFVYHRNYGRLAAGDRRSSLKGVSQADLLGQLESDIAGSFNLVTGLDSVFVDSASSIKPWHHESLFGTVELSLQRVGNITILAPPVYSPASKTGLSRLYESGHRSYPIDLLYSACHHKRRLIMIIPSELGMPQVSSPIHLLDSLWEFSFSTQWNSQTRELILDYDYRIEDGQCSPEKYESFARQVIEVYDSPLVFSSN